VALGALSSGLGLDAGEFIGPAHIADALTTSAGDVLLEQTMLEVSRPPEYAGRCLGMALF
jgi:hypothetical protein